MDYSSTSDSSSSSCAPDIHGDAQTVAVCSACGCAATESGVGYTGTPPTVRLPLGGLLDGGVSAGYQSGSCGCGSVGTFTTPYLSRENCGNIVKVVFPGGPIYIFALQSNGSCQQINGSGATLTGAVFCPGNGEVWSFLPFDGGPNQGSFQSVTLAGGQSFSATYNAYGFDMISSSWIDDDGQSHNETYTFQYNGDGTLASVTRTLQDTTVTPDLAPADAPAPTGAMSQIVYSYAPADGPHYDEGDLITITTNAADGAGGWNVAEQLQLGYYKDGLAGGYAGALKFRIGLDACRKMLAAGLDLTTDPSLSDEELLRYADAFFRYDSQGRVTTSLLQGGTLRYTLSYELASQRPGGAAYVDGPNQWKYRTVETRPDGRVTTTYANWLQQVLVKDCANGGQRWIENRQYDANANLLLLAHPSAVAGYVDDGGIGLTVNLRANDGLIETNAYYDGSDAPANYLKAESVQQGQYGTPVVLRQYTYTPGGSGSAVVYVPASTTVFRDDAGQQPITISYDYTWLEGCAAMQDRTTMLPAVPLAQNGSGVGASRSERFDTFGRLTWSCDELGTLTYRQYDPASGALVQLVEDVDPAQIAPPQNWPLAPRAAYLHRVTDYQVDLQGRTTQVLGPIHAAPLPAAGEGQGEGAVVQQIRTATWTIFKDPHAVSDNLSATWTASGYQVLPATGSAYCVLVNPVSIQRQDAFANTADVIQAVRSTTAGQLTAADVFPQTAWRGWTRTVNDNQNRPLETRVYHAIPASGDGIEGADGNFDCTRFAYDALGRQNFRRSPGGTITRTAFDARGGVAKIFVGTYGSPLPPGEGRVRGPANQALPLPSPAADPDNNMVLVSESHYHHPDGLLTAQIDHVDDDPLHARTTVFAYDWRDRRVATTDASGVSAVATYDNLDRVTLAQRLLGGQLLAQSAMRYDDRGRAYQNVRYEVDPQSGAVGGTLTDNSTYDDAGNVIQQQPGGSQRFTATQYDALGRVVKTLTECTTTAGVLVFEQSETAYDLAGNVLMTTLRQRCHDAVGPGELTTPTGAEPRARVTQVGHWYDGIGREIAVADYGTGTLDRVAQSTVPPRSDEVLVTETIYDDSGAAFATIDPAGRVHHQYHDAAGRLTITVENFCVDDDACEISPLSPGEGGVSGPATESLSLSGSGDAAVTIATGGASVTVCACSGSAPLPPLPVREKVGVRGLSSSSDRNITTLRTYTSDGALATLTAINSATGDQTTRYLYGTTLADSSIARSDLLRTEIYPDADSPEDCIRFGYNRQGQVVHKRDQNGTLHAFDYDPLGRLAHDRVVELGENIDGRVRSISRRYDPLGLLESVTSHGDFQNHRSEVVNEVRLEYNGLGLPVVEYQEHAAAVNVATSPNVRYGYDETLVNGELCHGLRPVSLTYPNGRTLQYTYGASGSAPDALNRLDAISDLPLPMRERAGVRGPSEVISRYTYLGLGTIVCESYAQPGVALDYIGTTPGAYSGFDAFGRVVSQTWLRGETPVDQFNYAYDRAGNRVYRQNALTTGKDELYAYDGVNRLIAATRGDLTPDHTEILNENFSQRWTLDATGNWSHFRDDAGGTLLDQRRAHNAANELLLAEAWSLPAFDPAGNMTRLPEPSHPSASLDCVYDAWNRLVAVRDGAHVIARYEYDGTNRRIAKRFDSHSPQSHRGLDRCDHFYHSRQLQVLETRVDGDAAPLSQFIWSPRYIDAPIVRDIFRDGTISPTDRLYYTADANMNVTGLLSASGKSLERYVYSPYGDVSVFDGAWTSLRTASLFGNEVLYTGRESDMESGLYYYRARYYNAGLGTFTGRDPIRYNNGANLYEYVGDQPVTRVDPAGMWWIILGVEPAIPLDPYFIPETPAFPRIYIPPTEPIFTPPQVPVMPVPPGSPNSGPNEPRPVGPNPDHYPPGYPSNKPWKCQKTESDCSEDELANLTSKVNKACPDHGFVSFPSPSTIWFPMWRNSCGDMEKLKDRWDECAKARRVREHKCFRGGNKGHQLALANAEFQVSYAYYLLRSWPCPGYGPPTDALGRPLIIA